jgi:AMP deaminase
MVMSMSSSSDGEATYSKISIEEGSDVDKEAPQAGRKLLAAMALRERYAALNPRQLLWTYDGANAFSVDNLPEGTEHKLEMKAGVYQWSIGTTVSSGVSVTEFLRDYNQILDVSGDGPVKTLSYKRLKILQLKYDLHVLLNGAREQAASQDDPRDFGNVMKVDTHIHLSAAMTSKHLLDFIRHKLRTESGEVVLRKNGVDLTLESVFNKLGIEVDSFTLNSLDTRADNTFQRFDHFNAKYNPFGKSELREVFLKSNNFMGGKYYAELTQQLFDRMARSKHVAAEYRVSIYGSNPGEWDELARWVIHHRLYTDKQRWLIQVPRIYPIFRKSGGVKNFEGLMANIFGPLFEASINPSSHPELHAFLNQVSGFDSVDDESKAERKFDDRVAEITPDKWDSEENPPYAYYSYYFWANVVSLNSLRASKGLKTFDFRPHCGESGDVDHLASSYLLATNISHGINLDKAIPLQYLYYLSQVGLAVSPLSNNALFLEYALNPFPKFFKRGLNVSLSTDDPLQFHHTEQPLIEEYATAAQKWELSDGDLSEIARNSILQSGFEHAKKKRWLGERYLEPGAKGNDISYTNVPDIRISFRQDNLDAEIAFLTQSAATQPNSFVIPRDIVEHMSRVALSQPYYDETEQDACQVVEKSLSVKCRYLLPSLTPEEALAGPDTKATPHYFRVIRGVINVFEGAIVNGKQFVATEPMLSGQEMVSYQQFESDMASIVLAFKHPSVISFATARLKLLDNKFGFHTLLNGPLEKELMRSIPTDFAHVTKVDNHVRLQHSMLARHFIKFVKEKVKNHSQDIVITSNGRNISLGTLYSALGIPIDNLTVDALYVRTDSGLTHLDESSMDAFVSSGGVSNVAIPTSSISSANTINETIQGRPKSGSFSDGTMYGVPPTSSPSHFGSSAVIEQLAPSIFAPPSTETSSPTMTSRSFAGNPAGATAVASSPSMFTSSIQHPQNKAASRHLTPSSVTEHASTALWHLYHIFLMSENDIEGRYFAELAREVLEKRGRNPAILHEFRLIHLGRDREEWDRIARWIIRNNLNGPNVQWLIELPPTYGHLKRKGLVENLQVHLDNLFLPLFEVTRDPASHPELAAVLPYISGVYIPHVQQHSGDSKVEHISPLSFNKPDQPPLTYFLYYLWANLYSLNAFRKSKCQHTLTLRATTDAAAHSNTKATLFALTSVIHNADLVLRNAPVLTYLCYLSQHSLTVSPLSSNTRARHYSESLFMNFFRHGQRVSLSSDNPLQLHMTNEPLNEEYAIASHMWKLSSCDLSEIARNSVLISGFPYAQKCKRIGQNFHLKDSVAANDSAKTNVPNTRVTFRHFTHSEECRYIKSAALSRGPSNSDLQSYFAPEQ